MSIIGTVLLAQNCDMCCHMACAAWIVFCRPAALIHINGLNKMRCHGSNRVVSYWHCNTVVPCNRCSGTCVQAHICLCMLVQDGLVSNWLWNNMRPGKTIGFKGVDGDFTLELIGSMAHSRTLLVAGGIGITPMRVMLAEQLARRQPTTLLYSVRTLSEAPFLNEFIEVKP